MILVPVDGRRPVAARSVPRSYKVQPGDTLAKLSQKFYGTSAHWKEIWTSNRKVIPSPNKIKYGVVIKVPNL
jgi:nucleoid-associated protein YgaU